MSRSLPARLSPLGLLVAMLLALALPAASQAGSMPIFPTREAPQVAGALSSNAAGSATTTAAFDELPPTSAVTYECSNGRDDDGDTLSDFPADPKCSSRYDNDEFEERDRGDGTDDNVPAAVGSVPLAGFGAGGESFGMLSTGDALSADAPDEDTGLGIDLQGEGYADRDGGSNTVLDLTTLRIELTAPAGASCLRFDYRFLTEEYPEFVDENVNDFFIAELDDTTFEGSGDGRDVYAPDNFALDAEGQLVSVNSTRFTEQAAAGTTYDGATPKLTASTPIAPGAHTLYLSIADQGDAIYDSTVLLDDLRFTSSGACEVPDDEVGPDTTISDGPGNGETITDTTPTFEFFSTERGSTYECSVDGAAFAECDTPQTTQVLGDNYHTFRVRSTDAAGNIDPSAARAYFEVDTNGSTLPDTRPPSLTITSGPGNGGSTNDTTPTFEFSSSDPTATFQCQIDFEEYVDCESPYTTELLEEGEHTFYVEARDRADNSNTDYRIFEVGGGGQPGGAPQTRITKAPKKVVTTRGRSITARFAFASSLAGSSFQCSIDGKPFGTCASPFAAKLGVGRHSFAVRASAGGVTDQTPAKATVTVKRKRKRG